MTDLSPENVALFWSKVEKREPDECWPWTGGNTVLVISRYDADEGDGHHYIHWPRERFCWFRDQPEPSHA